MRISLEEFKFLAPRVMVYGAVAYLTVQVVGLVATRVAKVTGLSDLLNR